MSASFYDLLKYAATGQASPSMTYYDKLRASTLMGGVVRTLTGQPPLTFKADGTPIISWSMKGNGSQTGTPTPDNPVMPEFVGVMTGNLFDKNAPDRTTTGYVKSDGSIQNSASFATSGYIPISGFETLTLSGYGDGNEPAYCLYDSNKDYLSGSAYTGRETITLTVGTATFIRMSYRNTAADTAMLNSGSTALPYEPFGWAEKITCAGQKTTVYLGEVPTVRRVKKVVFDGTEIFWEKSILRAGCFAARDLGIGVTEKTIYCTHAIGVITASELASNNTCYMGRDINLWLDLFDEQTTVEQFKTYLASEYQAGHPVTIWYVLNTEQTSVVNEPLCKISTYADELSSEDAAVTIPTSKGQNTLTVDTELQPSEMTITYKG